MKWEQKLAEIRSDLEKMVTACNKDEDYDGAAACQTALQHVARLDDVIEIPVQEVEWKP